MPKLRLMTTDESKLVTQDAKVIMPDSSTSGLLETVRNHLELDIKDSEDRLTSQQWTSSNPTISASTPNR
jgi:hypothetical protein